MCLSDKDDRKLFKVASEGLGNDDKFDEKVENAQRFLKLVGNRMEEFKHLDLFKVSSEWDMSTTALRVSTSHIDLFLSNVIDKNTMTKNCDLMPTNTATSKLLWFHIRNKVLPTTKTSPSVNFDELDVVHLKDHSYDVKKFNE